MHKDSSEDTYTGPKMRTPSRRSSVNKPMGKGAGLMSPKKSIRSNSMKSRDDVSANQGHNDLQKYMGGGKS